MKFKDIKDYLFGYEPLKQDIRTINSQLHNIDKNKVKQIYQKLSEINDNYIASFVIVVWLSLLKERKTFVQNIQITFPFVLFRI